jgi:type IV secretion system protein VirB5
MELTNPYLAARREWDERYGDLITRARNWRTLAIICAVTTLVATVGLMWLSAHSRIVPFVVLVDNLGRPLASGIAEQATVNDDRLKRASILAWVGDFRLVTSDGMAQRKAIDHVYGADREWQPGAGLRQRLLPRYPAIQTRADRDGVD